MTLAEMAATALFALGAFFFLGGTVGVLRFPDALTRLHALTKADNLGLGLIAFGTMLVAEDGWDAAKIALVWLVALAGSATTAYLVARHAWREAASERPPP